MTAEQNTTSTVKLKQEIQLPLHRHNTLYLAGNGRFKVLHRDLFLAKAR